MSYAAAAEAGPIRPGTGRVRHHLLPALLAAVAVAALVGTGSLDSDAALPVVVGVLQLALVAAWLPATGATAGTAVIGIAAAAGADAAFLVPARPHLGDLLV